MRAKFEEWRRVYIWAAKPGKDDDECDRRAEMLGEAERAVFAEPARDTREVLWKIVVMQSYEYKLRIDRSDAQALGVDLRALLGAEAEIAA